MKEVSYFSALISFAMTMLTLFSECHFWTLRDEVQIDSTDYGAFRYERNRDMQQGDMNAKIKRNYIESRNGTAIVKNSSKEYGRLKDNIKKLEEMLKTQTIVCAHWQDSAVVVLLFSNGLIAYICVDIFTGDILRMVFEKFFVGKLAAEVLSDAFFTRSHIVLAYNTNQLTVVHLQKPSKRSQGPEKIINMDPHIYHIVVPGPSERRISRNLVINSSFDIFVSWTKSSQNEVYPWRPTIRDQDRANIIVFKLTGPLLEAISYCWTENDPLCVDFLRSAESQIMTVEQKISSKGEVSAEICHYQINSGKMQRKTLISIGISSEICCHAFSPDQEKLILGLNDRSLCLHDLVQRSTKFKQIDIVPTYCSWNSDSSIVMIANDRSQFQCVDLALACLGNQLQSQDFKPSLILNLAHYFSNETKLLRIIFSKKPDLANYSHAYAQTDSFLLAIYENGPLCCMRFFGVTGMKGDIHNSGLTPDVLIDKYLDFHQLENAVNLLISLNWDTYGAMCLISLHKIANYVFFRSELNGKLIECLMQAFTTFSNSLSEETKDEFSDKVFDLKRRLFFYLLRNNLYVDAFNIAQDVEDYDLFMDIFNVTKNSSSYQELASSAYDKAAMILEAMGEEEVFQRAKTNNVDDSHLESSRSQSPCSDSTATAQYFQQQRHQYEMSSSALQDYLPPLPSIKPKMLNTELIRINIPKPELKIISQHQRLPPHSTSIPDYQFGNFPSTTCTIPNLLKNMSSMQKGKITGEIIKSNNSQDNVCDKKTFTKTTLYTSEDVYIPSVVNNLVSRTSNEVKILPYSSVTNELQHRQNIVKSLQLITPSLPFISIETKGSRMQRTHQESYQPKFYEHPLVSVTIPPSSNSVLQIQQDLRKCLQKKPSASILSNGTSQNGSITNCNTSEVSTMAATSKEFSNKAVIGEKNKVKFSDTVQVAVVPEISRKDKVSSSQKNFYLRPNTRNLTYPKKELADSLPLCHPNDDYLKDFNPLQKVSDDPKISALAISANEDKSSPTKMNSPSIKVVHFGVV